MNDYKQIYYTDYWINEVRPYILRKYHNICQGCNKLILKKPTVHHIIELNDKNYTDYNIAYGEDNLTLLCPKCHNKVHEKGFYNFNKKIITDENLNIDYSKRKGQQ